MQGNVFAWLSAGSINPHKIVIKLTFVACLKLCSIYCVACGNHSTQAGAWEEVSLGFHWVPYHATCTAQIRVDGDQLVDVAAAHKARTISESWFHGQSPGTS